jgi:hypothetical protein
MSTTVDLGKITASVDVGTTTTGAAGTNASVSNSGTTQDAVLNFTIPRGAQGVQGPQGSTGPQGPAGPTGPQGPMGDVAVITPEQQAAFTMYSTTGQNTDGPMTQKAVTDALVASAISYDNSQSGLDAENVQEAMDLCSSKHDLNYYSYVSKYYLNANGEPTYIDDSKLLLAKFVVYGGETVAIKGRSGNTGTLASVRNSSGAQIAQYEIGKGKVYTDLDPFVVTLPQGSAYLYVTGHATLQPPEVNLTSDLKNVDNTFRARCDYATIYPTEGAKYIHNNQGEGNICDITNSSNFVAHANYAYYLIDCVEGDSFKITGDGASNARLFCFLDSSMKILLMADVDVSYTDHILRAPVNSAYLVVDLRLNVPYSLKKAYKTSETISAVNELEKDVTYQEITSYTEFPYTIAGGVWKSINQRTSCLIYVAHIRGKRIQLFPNPTKSEYKIAFFNSVPVVNANAPYCSGTTAITSDEEYQTIPNDALYLWVRYNNPNEDGLWYPSKIIMPYGVNNMLVKIENSISNIEEEMKEVNPNSLGVTLYNYDGLKPNFRNQFGVTLLQTLPSWVRSQGCAVIGDYMIVGMAFDNSSNAQARVYNLATNTLLGQITFNFGNYYKAHSNTICFGVEYPDANSPFPALYLSQLDNTGLANKGSEFGVLVYSISSSYVSTFLQAIIPDKTDQALMSAIGAGTPNYIVDAENGNLWVVGYKYASWVNSNNIQTFVKFKLPLLSDGTEVVLTHDDILDSFELPMSPYSAVQESVFKNGRLYCQMGIESLVIQGLRIVNVETHSIETSLFTTQIFTTEPQGIAFYNNDMIWYDSNQNGSLYKFNFY